MLQCETLLGDKFECCWSALQHVAVVCCRVLQCVILHTAAHCNTLRHTAAHCSTLHHTATHCDTLQHPATHCNTLQHTATHCNTLQLTLQHTATHCNTLQHTAAHLNLATSLNTAKNTLNQQRCLRTNQHVLSHPFLSCSVW